MSLEEQVIDFLTQRGKKGVTKKEFMSLLGIVESTFYRIVRLVRKSGVGVLYVKKSDTYYLDESCKDVSLERYREELKPHGVFCDKGKLEADVLQRLLDSKVVTIVSDACFFVLAAYEVNGEFSVRVEKITRERRAKTRKAQTGSPLKALISEEGVWL